MSLTQERGLIAHEWIEPIGGSENVVDELASMWPDADLYSLWTNAPGRYPNHRCYESRMARSTLRGRKAVLLPFMSREWRSVDLRDYDWALISSHAFAHHVGAGRFQRHLKRFVYVHTPARYLWAPDIDPRGQHSVVRAVAPMLRRLDRRHVQDGAFAANSEFVRERIGRAWGVDSQVIHPPVAVADLQRVERWSSTLDSSDSEIMESLPDSYLVGASRFVTYKHLDRVLDFAKETDREVVIAGRGPDEMALRAYAAQHDVRAHFVISPSNSLLRAVIQEAVAFVYPPVEDFGIMAAEAVALGTPIIVNQRGGAKEIVAKTGGGVSTDFGRPDLWIGALEILEGIDMTGPTERSREFDKTSFGREVMSWMRSHC